MNFNPSGEYLDKKREADAIRKDIAAAREIISEGILRYKKKKLRARSKKQAAGMNVFDVLKEYADKTEIQNAYGWDYITQTEMHRLMDLWDAREQYINEFGKFQDRVTDMLQQAIQRIGDDFQDTLEEFDSIERRHQIDLERIERENQKNVHQRYINGL